MINGRIIRDTSVFTLIYIKILGRYDVSNKFTPRFIEQDVDFFFGTRLEREISREIEESALQSKQIIALRTCRIV